MPLFCQVSSEKAEGGVCAKPVTGLQLPRWGKRSPIYVLGVEECLWTSVPSSGQWRYDWCLNFCSTLLFPHLSLYFLFLTTLVLSSLVTSKDGRLTHCEINFSMFSHHFLFGGIFKILSYVIVSWKDSSINLKNYSPRIFYCHVSASFTCFFFKKAVWGSLPFALYGSLKKSHIRSLGGLHCFIPGDAASLRKANFISTRICPQNFQGTSNNPFLRFPTSFCIGSPCAHTSASWLGYLYPGIQYRAPHRETSIEL